MRGSTNSQPPPALQIRDLAMRLRYALGVALRLPKDEVELYGLHLNHAMIFRERFEYCLIFPNMDF